MKKILIAYFSKEGGNFVKGKEKELAEGNTEKIARMIQKNIGGDLFAIEPLLPYPASYDETVKLSKAEKEQNARPAVKTKVEGMDDYEVIFLGYPNWWGTCPMVVLSFLEQYHLAGKEIITFCTHEGSRSLYSLADIQASAKGATVKEGAALNGSYLSAAEPTVKEWLDSLKADLQ
jgi:flavodoxin